MQSNLKQSSPETPYLVLILPHNYAGHGEIFSLCFVHANLWANFYRGDFNAYSITSARCIDVDSHRTFTGSVRVDGLER